MNIKETLSNIKDKIIDWKTSMFTNTKEKFIAIIEKIKFVLGGFIEWMNPVLKFIWEVIEEPVKALWEAIYNFIGATVVLVMTTASVIVWIVINFGLAIAYKREENKKEKE